MKKILALTFALVLCLGIFVSCASAEKMEKKLEDEGYTVVSLDADTASDILSIMGIDEELELDGGIVSAFTASKGVFGDKITVVEFEKSSDAKKVQEALNDDDGKIGRSGSVIYFGSEDAVNIIG